MSDADEGEEIPGGLSTVHICTEPKISISEGGKFVQLKWPMKRESQGTIGAKRGNITDFSRKSRQRLQRAFAVLDDKAMGLPVFITLTYPGEYSGNPAEWKRNLHAIKMAFVRAWPEITGYWRLEFQKRGAPHFHLLVWNGPEIEVEEIFDTRKQAKIWMAVWPDRSEQNRLVMEWLSATWYRIVKSGDEKHLAAGTKIEPMQSWNGVSYYLTKYLCKLPEGSFVPVDWVGRFWGVIQGQKLKKHPLFEAEIPEKVFYKVRRVLRKGLEKQMGRKLVTWKRQGITRYMDGCQAMKLLGEVYGDWKECPF